MRKLKHLLLLLALALPARADELSVVVGGRASGGVSAYKVGSSYYLDARRAGELYGAQVYWYQVSGRLKMSLRGKQAQFTVDSDEALLGGRKVKLPARVMLRANQAFIPLEFLLSEDFEAFAGMDGHLEAGTRTLELERRATVGPVRWFSYRDRTRIAMELAPGVKPALEKRGLKGLEVVVPLGVADAPSEETKVGDELVTSFTLKQDAKTARLMVLLARPGLTAKTMELDSPRRFVLDIVPDKDAVIPTAAASEEAQPEPAKPVAVAPDPPVAPATPPPVEVVEPAAPATAAEPKVHAKPVIVIDAGHGGKDSGAIGRRGSFEKDHNLKAALELARMLREDGLFEVRLTRSDDEFVPLADRSQIANDAGADLFVSLHCNGSPNSREKGYEVYFLSERATDEAAELVAQRENAVLELEGKSVEEEQASLILHAMGTTENINQASELAALVHRAIGKRVDLEPRGVKQASFYVLRGTYAPAVLVELAFVTHKGDEAQLENKKSRRKIIEGVHAGIMDYARRKGWVKGVAKGR